MQNAMHDQVDGKKWLKAFELKGTYFMIITTTLYLAKHCMHNIYYYNIIIFLVT